VISPIPHSRLAALSDSHPRLASKIFWSFASEAAMSMEHLIDVGRRSALERVAHFLLELHARLEIIGLADERSYAMPLTQELVADILGLSVPHVNRTLRQLRDDQLLRMEGQRVVIADFEGLSNLAGFKRTYLDRLRIPETPAADVGHIPVGAAP
jgi:CRP-like cAMP-binding protein